jgi:hypothetical protein
MQSMIRRCTKMKASPIPDGPTLMKLQVVSQMMFPILIKAQHFILGIQHLLNVLDGVCQPKLHVPRLIVGVENGDLY